MKLLSGALLACLCLVSPSFANAASRPLAVGSDISYAPLEFFAGSKQVKGFDYDLAQALGAELGASVGFENHDFNDLIASLQRGRYDFVMSAMSDTRDREQQVDFIDYFLAGSGLLVPANNPNHIHNIASLCGMTVDLQRGTSQEKALIAQSKDCVSVGLHPVKMLLYATDDDALKQFLAGHSMAHVSDYPVVSYLAQTLGHGKKYIVAGEQFGVVPYGIAVSKRNPQLRARLQNALLAIIADGTYDKLLKKWSLEQGAMRSAPINAGTKFE
jgi:polar amino acid transport system substrate-binding protein